MILVKLALENFRQIAGRAEVRFAAPGDRNVTVVLGQNGAGKTTVLNSFLWCLYGKVELENPSEIVCHKAVQDAPIGGEVAAEVTLVVKDGARSHTITRRIAFRKQDGGKLDEIDRELFRVDTLGPDGVTRAEGDPIHFVRQLLPESLSGFFFFRGEEVEALAMRSSEGRLKSGVSEFLNFTLLDRAVNDLKKVATDFSTERANKASEGAVKQAIDAEAAADEEVKSAKARLETAQANIRALEDEIAEVEKKLAASEEVRPLMEEREKLVARKQELERKEADDRRAVSLVLSRDGFLCAGNDTLGPVKRLCDESERKGEIPAKIKPSFVEHLLSTGVCVCDRPLDDYAREHLTRWRENAGLAVVEEGITRLRGSVIHLAERRTRAAADLAARRGAWAETRAALRTTHEQISAKDSEINGKDVNLDEVRGLQGRRKKLTDDRIELAAGEARAADAVAAAEAKLLEKQAESRRMNKDHSQTQTLQRRLDATRNVADALRKMRDGWLAIVQEYLDGQLKRNWGRVAQLDRMVEFVHDFRLGIKERGPDGEWTASAPSAANQRALALCFVSALIKLANEIGAEARQRPDARASAVFQGGEYPLVMDAPFATMEHFKKTIPAGLRSVVPQMVLFSSYDQWSGEVEQNLRPAVGCTYVLELHLNKPDAGTSISVGGRRVDYVVPEPEATTDWTVIHEVTE